MTLSRRRTQFIVFLVAATVLLPYLYSRIRSPWQRVRLYSSLDAASRVGSAEEIRIACYNIAHGRGIASSNWDGGNARERLARLDAIADLLRTMDADVVVLNEVDFDSSWSYSMNQARYLAQQAGYPYWVEARNLDFRVLVWKWRFGNAILSKHRDFQNTPPTARVATPSAFSTSPSFFAVTPVCHRPMNRSSPFIRSSPLASSIGFWFPRIGSFHNTR